MLGPVGLCRYGYIVMAYLVLPDVYVVEHRDGAGEYTGRDVCPKEHRDVSEV